jgi:broad specificity phosphatase PhoE
MKPTLNQEETGFLENGRLCFGKTFKRAMSFHYPEGLAAVSDESGAYHITINGAPMYTDRYIETFGFYHGIATVRDYNGYFHIDTTGKPFHSQRYIWSGNFQEGRCVVQDAKGFFHINSSFTPLYNERFDYVGDLRYGIAAVRRGNVAYHIYDDGSPLNGHFFENVDVFHKGFAVVRNKQGAFHINKQGQSIYEHRFKSVEPFYNGFSLCKTGDDRWIRLMENGHYKHLPARRPVVHIQEIVDRMERGEGVSLILRHAERDPIAQGEWGDDAKLNRHGQLAAQSLGQILGRKEPDWTFVSSPIERCIDTCHHLSRGLGTSLNASDIIKTSLLGNPGPFKDTEQDQSHLTPENFMKAALLYIYTGHGKGFRALIDGCRDMMNLAEKFMKDGPTLLITHDFFIAGLFDHLGLHHPTPDGWVEYLDGVCFFSNGWQLTEWRRFQGLKEIALC